MASILIADEDPDIRALLRLKFGNVGHTVYAAPDAERALAHARDDPPELAVLGVMMPGLKGLDLIDGLRAEEGLARLPIVVLSARAQPADVELGLAQGADDYITKPFSPSELVRRAESLLSRSRR